MRSNSLHSCACSAACSQGSWPPPPALAPALLLPPPPLLCSNHDASQPIGLLAVAVPTLVLWGMDDPALLPGLLDGLPGWVPLLQLRQVEKASHWIVHEHPERVALELQRFLQSKK